MIFDEALGPVWWGVDEKEIETESMKPENLWLWILITYFSPCHGQKKRVTIASDFGPGAEIIS